MKIHQLVAEAVQKFLDNDAVVHDNGMTSQSVTYRQLWETVEQISSSLSSLHIDGKITAVILSESLHLPAILLGLLSCKCAFYPVTANGQRYISESIRRVGASWIIHDERFEKVLSPVVEQLKGESKKCDVLENLGMKLIHLPVDDASEDTSDNGNIAYCITTSGTTGTPKVIRVPHACISPNITDFRQIFQMNSEDKVLLTAPLTFDPSIIDVFLALTSGATLLIIPQEVKSNPDKFLDIVHTRQNVSVIQATPSLLRQCSSHLLRETIFGPNSSLRVLALGGEEFPSSSELKKWISQGSEIQFYNLYGITEVSCWATCEAINADKVIRENGIVSIGIPLSNTMVHVDKESCPDFPNQGFIWIGSLERVCKVETGTESNLSSASHEESSTHPRMSQERECLPRGDAVGENKNESESGNIVWRNTGDLGQVLEDGRIVFLGRRDDQVKRHGKRMSLSALEQVCCELSWVSNCCALIDEDSRLIVFFTSDTNDVNFSVTEEEKNTDSQAKTEVESWCREENVKNQAAQPVLSNIERESPVLKHEESVENHGAKPAGFYLGRDSSVLEQEDDKKLNISDDWMRNDMAMERLKSHVHGALPSHYMPDRFIPCQAFPITPHGKLDKRKLLDMRKVDEPVIDLSIASPLSVSRQIWQKFLPRCVPEINLEDTFLLLGGDSLAAVNLVNYLEHHFGNAAQHFMYLLVNKDFSCFIEYFSTLIWSKESITGNFVTTATNINEKINTASDDKKESGRMYLKQDCGEVESTEESVENKTKMFSPNAYQHLDFLDIGKEVKADVSIQGKETYVSDTPEIRNNSHGLCVICRGNKVTQINKKLKGVDNYLFHEISEHVFVCDGCRNSETRDFLCERCNRRSRQDVLLVLENPVDYTSDKSKCDYSRNVSLQCTMNYTGKKKRQREKIVSDLDSREKDLASNKSLNLRWRVDTRKCVDASPVIAVFSHRQSIAFIGSHSGQFTAVDVQNGETKWMTVLPDRIESSANICQKFSSVIVGCYDGFLYQLDIETGAIKWKFQTGDCVKCSPSAVSGHVICGSHDGYLYSLNMDARECVWKHHLGGGSIYSSSLVNLESGLVYAASLSGRLAALDLSNGELVWCVELKKPLFSSPCCHGQCLLIGCVDGLLYCVNGASGHTEWTFQTQGPIFSSPVSQDGFAFFGCHDKSFYCLTSTGQLVWKFDAANPVFSTPFLFHPSQSSLNSTSNVEESKSKRKKAKKSLVVFASTDGVLNVLDSLNGNVVASTHLPGEVFSSPIVYEEHILIGCRDNFLYCFDISF